MKCISIFILLILVFLQFSSSSFAQRMSPEEKLAFNIKRLDMDPFLPMYEAMILEYTTMADIAVPALVDVIREEDDEKTVRSAIYILGRLGPASEKAVIPITRALTNKESSAEIKSTALGALGRIGEKSSPSIPTIAQYLYNEDLWLSEQAERALKSINNPAANAALKEFYVKRNSAKAPLVESDKKDLEK